MISKFIKGFSLIELSIVIALTGILFLFSFSFLSFFQNNQDQIIQKKILQAIQIAQLESMAKKTTIGICKSTNQKNCSGDWQHNQLIFIDGNHDGTIANRESIVAVIKLNIKYGSLFWRSYPFYREYVAFLPNGTNDNGTFWFCLHGQAAPRFAITLNKAGITHVLYPDKKGEITDKKGVLTCNG